MPPPDDSSPDYGPTVVDPTPDKPSPGRTTPPVAPVLPAEVAAAPASARFGKFVRTDRLGAGGMGEVWKAWDTQLSRWVALKFMREQDADEIARFLREARLAGQLSHPHIAATHEVGVDQDKHFIAMQFVDGQTLLTFPRTDRRLVARLIRDAATAVEYAHEKGVIHRDLKPQNMMVTSRSGSRGRGEPHVYVMDFGLARSTLRGPDRSASGDVVGTPAYMSPEQARGERVGPQADVYSLGATLYEMLTGRPPYVARTALETLRLIADSDIWPPRVLDPSVDAELDTICMKCLEKDRRARYRTARELADDLSRWLAGEPIRAHPPTLWYRLRKRLARRRGLVAALLLGFASVAGAVGILGPMALRESRENDRASRALALGNRVSWILAEAELDARAGEVKRQQARLDEGIEVCRAELAREEMAHAHYFMGRLLRARGRTDEAMAEFDRAVSLGAMAEARFERGLLCLELYARQLEEVMRTTSRAWSLTAIDREYPELARLRARASGDLGADMGKNEAFRRVDVLYGRAELARIQGEPGLARRILKEILEAEPAYVRAYLSLARIASELAMEGTSPEEREAHDREALALSTRALEMHRGLAEAHVLRARSRYRLREANPSSPSAPEWGSGAAQDAAAAMALGLRTFETLIYSGDGKLEAKDWFGAQDDFEAALARQAGHAVALAGRARARQGQGRLAEAMADFDAAIQASPGRSSLHLARARLHLLLKDPESALRDFSEALLLNPQSGEAAVERARIHLDRGDFNAASRDLHDALERFPELPHAHRLRAAVHIENKAYALAERDLTSALRIDPGDNAAAVTLGRVFILQGRFQDAIVHLNACLRAQPSDPDALSARGEARLRDNRNLADALDDLSNSLYLRPNSLPTLLLRAELSEKLGRRRDALRDLGSILALDPAHPAALSARADLLFLDKAFDACAADITALLRVPTRDRQARAWLFLRRARAHEAARKLPSAASDYEDAIAVGGPEWTGRSEAVNGLLRLRP